MKIIFANAKEFEYIDAYSLERDFKDGYTRPSLEIMLPIIQTSYNEIAEILNDFSAMKIITLVGEPILNEDGTYGETPTSIFKDYTIKGKISIEDDILTFKIYRLSDVEIENREAKEAIDELLITMGR